MSNNNEQILQQQVDSLMLRVAAMQSELESLKRERVMLVEALKIMLENTESDDDDSEAAHKHGRFVLSATEPQATQWLESKLLEARAQELINCHGMSEMQRTHRLDELRLAASKRKEQV